MMYLIIDQILEEGKGLVCSDNTLIPRKQTGTTLQPKNHMPP
jgi:hypothetical protein